jgi:putative ABC transport system substrate-binding protein
MRRIGVLMPHAGSDPEAQARLVAFVQGLQEQGWTVGRNVRIDIRWAAGDPELFRRYAAELVALAPDVILGAVTTSVRALLEATRTIPIVFASATDPVGGGLIASLARPGSNVTGFSVQEFGLRGKALEFLKELAPNLSRVAVLRDSTTTGGVAQFAAVQTAAPALGMELIAIDSHAAAGQIERAIAGFARQPNGGLIVPTGAGGEAHPRTHHQAGGPAAVARNLSVSLLGERRRASVLRTGRNRPVPARGRLRRSHPQGREAGRPAGAGASQVRAGDQSQDREGARP